MPGEYRLQLERAARRGLERVPEREYGRIERAIDGLAIDPRPRGCIKVGGSDLHWRIRVGDYRVIYSVFDRERIVKIVRIARRNERTYDVLS